MNKILIDVYFPKSTNGKRKFVATSKACDDVTRILTEQGFDRKIIYRSWENSILGTIQLCVKLLFSLLKMHKESIVIVQYPMMNIMPFSFCSFLFKRFHSIAVVHDIRSYCHLPQYHKKEIKILNCFKGLIVHNEKMKQTLKNDGVNTNMETLGCFDYLLEDGMKIKECPKNTIMFAGNLSKSIFLNNLQKLNFRNVKFNLYGGQKPDIPYTDYIEYKGRFLPSDISSIEAEWGLIWEGDSIDTCSGVHGQYLKLIAPHKMSLYLACGLKLICWDQSAMASMIIEKGLGFTIKSLDEIEDKISSMSPNDILQIEKNVTSVSSDLRKGKMLQKALEKIL